MSEGLPPPSTALPTPRSGCRTSRARHDGGSRGPTSSWGSLHTEGGTDGEKVPPPMCHPTTLALRSQVSQLRPHSPSSCRGRRRSRGSGERGSCEQSAHSTTPPFNHPTPLPDTHRVATGAGPRAAHSGAPRRDSGGPGVSARWYPDPQHTLPDTHSAAGALRAAAVGHVDSRLAFKSQASHG